MAAIATIRDLANASDRFGPIAPWRTKLLPANYKGRLFHTEAGNKESGRSIVLHEFPKKDLPYAEDLGKRATEFTVRGYCIQYPDNTGVPLYMRDYTIARDQLEAALLQGGAGSLQLPMQAPMVVACTRYRLTEEERLGGYCIFDMTFVEQGASPFTPVSDPTETLISQSKQLREAIVNALKQPPASKLKAITGVAAGSARGRPFTQG